MRTELRAGEGWREGSVCLCSKPFINVKTLAHAPPQASRILAADRNPMHRQALANVKGASTTPERWHQSGDPENVLPVVLALQCEPRQSSCIFESSSKFERLPRRDLLLSLKESRIEPGHGEVQGIARFLELGR